MLVNKYHDSHCEDKEVLITIKKAIDSSPELRSKKLLIENFISGINDVDEVMAEWSDYVNKNREEELLQIIDEESLKESKPGSSLKMHFVMVKSKLQVRKLISSCRRYPVLEAEVELLKNRQSLIS